MLRYKLRTLLILLAVGPPLVAGVWWKWQEWRLLSDIQLPTDLEEWNYAPTETSPLIIWQDNEIDSVEQE